MAGTDQNGASAAAASDAVEAYRGDVRIDRIELANGIVLALKTVPPLLISEAARRVPQPPIPVVHSEAKDRDEENPADPQYLQDVIKWRAERDEAGLNVALIMGTEPVSIPDGMHPPSSDEWITEIEATYAAIDMEPPEIVRDRDAARYLSWCRLYALSTEYDIVRITAILTAAIAVSEEDVREIVDSFRDEVRRTADIEGKLLKIAANRDRDRTEAAGDGEPVRGA